jgi:NADPH:quinone reductase-like Zn-dependent oxidoreductase
LTDHQNVNEPRMKAIVCEQWGEPDRVLQVREVPVPQCGPSTVRVRMLASPINPSDLFMVRGIYGKQPPLPCTPGFEGVGIVEEGRGLLGWRVKGKRVAVLNSAGGNWAEQVIIPARQAVPVPADLSDEQAATFFVNPASAIVMTRCVLRVPPGAWLLQTAAASALGRMVIRLGVKHNFRTINVVRRREPVEELTRLGGTAVVVAGEEPLLERVMAVTKGEGVPFAIDAVGGDLASQVVQTLGHGGRMLLYSTLSEKPLTLDPRALMTVPRRIEGFWLSAWVREQGPLRMLGLFRRIKALLREGVVTTDVGKTFSLEEVRAAVAEAARPARHGKVLLKMGTR